MNYLVHSIWWQDTWCDLYCLRFCCRMLLCLPMILRPQNYHWGFLTLRRIKSWWFPTWSTARYVRLVCRGCSRYHYVDSSKPT